MSLRARYCLYDVRVRLNPTPILLLAICRKSLPLRLTFWSIVRHTWTCLLIGNGNGSPVIQRAHKIKMTVPNLSLGRSVLVICIVIGRRLRISLVVFSLQRYSRSLSFTHNTYSKGIRNRNSNSNSKNRQLDHVGTRPLEGIKLGLDRQ
jgi:hypothetical protein